MSADRDAKMRDAIEAEAAARVERESRSGKQINQDSERRRIAALMEKNDRVQRDRRK